MTFKKLMIGLMLLLAGPALAQTGVVADGGVGVSPRPLAQLMVDNSFTGDHTIITMNQTIPCEESAIESVGYLSNTLPQQQGAQFWRWLNCNNTAVPVDSDPGFEATWSMHLTKYGTDNTPLVLLARNSAILCAGYTPLFPWQGVGVPPANWIDVRCPQRVRGYINIGPNLTFDRNSTLPNLSVEGRAEIGRVNGSGYIDRALQWGYSDSAGVAYVQAYAPDLDIFLTLNLGGAEINVGYDDQKIGFMGATPIARPAVSGSRLANPALAPLITALASLGLVTDSTVP